MAAILNFFLILNMGFCFTIIGKLHTKKEKYLPVRFQSGHTFIR